jgi:isoquinoline 1-oxidoreductase beta subunit
MTVSDLERRQFLKLTTAAGGGLLIGFHLPSPAAASDGYHLGGKHFSPNSWIHLAPDDTVTLMVATSELGQGSMTAIPMLLAEELESDWTKVKVAPAPVNSDFNNPLTNAQMTGGSTAVRGYWEPLRRVGAGTRELLIAAAAKIWGVKAKGCQARNSEVIHTASGRRLRYGALLVVASQLTPPTDVRLKNPKRYRLIGKSIARLDTPAKVNGSTVFGCDVRVPGMLTAVVARCPVFGGKPKGYDAGAAHAIPGVQQVAAIDSGIAVVANSFWSAQRGRAALAIQWDTGSKAKLDSAAIQTQLRAALQRRGKTERDDGDVDQALVGAARVVEALYETPYLAHACMEPMNCTAQVRADRCDVWVPTQAQTAARAAAAQASGLPESAVAIHTTFAGGGFGRRLQQDFVIEAVQLSKAVGAPVQVLWTREDDMQHDFYRPANCTQLRAALDARGVPRAWFQRIAGPRTALRGVTIPYAINNVRVEQVEEDPGVPVGAWRSVGASQNGFTVECFIDELAHAAGADPLAYRLALLKQAPRHRVVLQLAADKAGWGKKLPVGHGRGIAVYESFGGWVAHVVEVAVVRGVIRVRRVVSAVDCGLAVNPAGVRDQTESAITFALTAALEGEITIRDGRVVQGNFNDQPLLRIDELPAIEVHLVPSREPPGGVGEPGVPPLAPALANAVFAATGQRLRRLPLRLEQVVAGSG